MPVERYELEEHEERLARVETMLEQLRHEMQMFSEMHRQTVEDAHLSRERSAAARVGARKAQRAAQDAKQTAAVRVAQARKSKA